MAADSLRWIKLYLSLVSHPKVERLCEEHGPTAVLYYIAALIYSAAMDTDGRISARMVDVIPLPLDVSHRDRAAIVRSLVRLRLWEEITAEEYVIHNWSKYQRGYIKPAQGGYPGEDVAVREELSTGLGTTLSTGSGSEVTFKDKDLSLSLSDKELNNKRRVQRVRACIGAPTYERENEAGNRVTVCSSCSLPHGLHVEDCPLATSPSPGTGIAPVPGTPSGERCPSCGVGWGGGHSEDCNYDPRSPLTYSDNGTNVPEVMANAPRARLLRQRMNALRPEHEQRNEDR